MVNVLSSESALILILYISDIVSGFGTFYNSTVSRTVARTSDGGNYTCTVRVLSSLNLLSSSRATSGFSVINVG